MPRRKKSEEQSLKRVKARISHINEDFSMNDAECKSCSKEPVERINVLRFIDKLDSFLEKRYRRRKRMFKVLGGGSEKKG